MWIRQARSVSGKEEPAESDYKSPPHTPVRMPTPQANRAHRWTLTLGCCLVCGSPMELPGRRLDSAAGESRDMPVGAADDDSVVTEDPVRACMFAHHLLPRMEVSNAVYKRLTFVFKCERPDAPCRSATS